MATNLLLPFDGSPAALRATELVAGYRAAPAALAPTVLNVQARPVRLWPEGALDPSVVEAALLDAGRSAIEPAIGRLAAAGMQVQAAVRLGFASQTILEEARSREAEAIVMGTRGHGALQGSQPGAGDDGGLDPSPIRRLTLVKTLGAPRSSLVDSPRQWPASNQTISQARCADIQWRYAKNENTQRTQRPWI